MLRSIAVALCLPLLVAAKPVIDNEGYAKLTIRLLGAAPSDPGQRLDVQSWHWGPRQSAGRGLDIAAVDGQPVNAGVKDGAKDLQAQDRMGNYDRAAGGHSMLGASDKLKIHDPPPPRDGGLGSESELTVGPHPLPGSLTLKVNLLGCAVGKRYAGAQFASATMRYELQDVVISNCAPGAVTLDYRKVTVRGWNPETKEL